MNRGSVSFVIFLAVLGYEYAASSEIESSGAELGIVNWKAEAVRLKAKLLEAESTIKAQAGTKSGRLKGASLGNALADNAKTAARTSKWDAYKVVSDENKKDPKRFWGAQKRMSWWTQANQLAFSALQFEVNWKPTSPLFVKNTLSSSGNKFPSEAACMAMYEQKVKEFGTCGKLGGAKGKWRKLGCCPPQPDTDCNMADKPGPCVGTFKKAADRHGWQSNPDSVTATARYEELKSIHDGKKHSFYTL